MAHRTRSAKVIVTCVAAIGLSVVGCSEAKEAVNRGGDTTCGDFRTQSSDDQRITVTKFLKERSGDKDATPAPLVVDAAITAIGALCAVDGNDKEQIRNASIVPDTAPK